MNPLQHWNKFNTRLTDRRTIADILEMYANGMQINDIELLTGKSRVTITAMISRYWFYQKLDNPVTITLQSKA